MEYEQPKTVRLIVSITKSFSDEIEEAANIDKVSKAEFVRAAIRHVLDENYDKELQNEGK